jgi:hypothetical protein
MEAPRTSRYYAAQGNASRLFFRAKSKLPDSLEVLEATSFASFTYLLSGGLSKPAFYPAGLLPLIRSLDSALSYLPRIFGARCLVVIGKRAKTAATAPNLG